MNDSMIVVRARNVGEAWDELDPQNRPGHWSLVSVDAGYYMFVRDASEELLERLQEEEDDAAFSRSALPWGYDSESMF